MRDILSNRPLTEAEVFEARARMLQAFKTLNSKRKGPDYADILNSDRRPRCSMQMLGYINTSMITEAMDRSQPIVGISKVRFQVLNSDTKRNTARDGSTESENSKFSVVEWQCMYRALHENWRLESKYAAPHFRATVYYCFSSKHGMESESFYNERRQDVSCTELQQVTRRQSNPSPESVPVVVSLPSRVFGPGAPFTEGSAPSPKLQWTDVFHINLPENGIKDRYRKSKALCLVLPYTSSSGPKQDVNDAILSEFMRYYQLLDFKIFVYDRDGAHQTALFESSAYKSANNISSPVRRSGSDAAGLKSVVYYPYTIRGLLDVGRNNLKYDNMEAVIDPAADIETFKHRQSRFETQVSCG
jgi:hypothetical protein